jgi:hypothetical protein
MAVDEFPTDEICTGLVTVEPEVGLQMVIDGGPDVGEHVPPPPVTLLVTVTIAESLLVESATLVATIV